MGKLGGHAFLFCVTAAVRIDGRKADAGRDQITERSTQATTAPLTLSDPLGRL